MHEMQPFRYNVYTFIIEIIVFEFEDRMKYSLMALFLTAALVMAAEPTTGTPAATDTKTAQTTVTLAPGINKKAAPLDGLTWVKGEAVKIEPGKAYLIEFWATWCPPCKESIPHLTQLQQTYGDKITVIGISNEAPEIVKPFVEGMGERMNYRVALDSQDKGKVTQAYSQAYNQTGIPHAFIVDQKGLIVWYGHPQEGMAQVLAQVAAGTFDPVVFAQQKADAEALNNQLTAWYMEYFSKVQSEGSSLETDRIATNFIEKAHPEALLSFSWNILIKFKTDARSMKLALKAAEKANMATGGTEPMVLDTFATALFENGLITEAIAAEQKAVQLSMGNPQMQDMFQKRLMEFKTKTYQKPKVTK